MLDHMFTDGLEDAYTGRAMGTFAQETADAHGITREEMDAFAIESLNRAKAAIEDGRMATEISPVTVSSRRGDTVVEHDAGTLAVVGGQGCVYKAYAKNRDGSKTFFALKAPRRLPQRAAQRQEAAETF